MSLSFSPSGRDLKRTQSHDHKSASFLLYEKARKVKKKKKVDTDLLIYLFETDFFKVTFGVSGVSEWWLSGKVSSSH